MSVKIYRLLYYSYMTAINIEKTLVKMFGGVVRRQSLETITGDVSYPAKS